MLQQIASENNVMIEKSNKIKIVISKADGENMLFCSEECKYKNIKLVLFVSL